MSVQLGERHVRAIKAGFIDGRETIELKGGSSGRVTLKLAPAVKTTLVNVSVIGPASAVVKVDGKEVGQAPYKGQVGVSAEPHQFSAEAPGYVTATQSALVREGEPLNLTLQLAQDQQKGKLVVLAKPEGATIEIDGKTVGASRWEGPVDVGTHQIVVRKTGPLHVELRRRRAEGRRALGLCVAQRGSQHELRSVAHRHDHRGRRQHRRHLLHHAAQGRGAREGLIAPVHRRHSVRALLMLAAYTRRLEAF